MPYLWTRPRRKRAYGVVFWLLYVVLMGLLWGVTRESWLSYSAVPLLKNVPGINGNVGRLTTVVGVQSYLTIDRDQVDPSGVPAKGAAPSEQWRWDVAALVWSGVYTIAGAFITYLVIRLLVASGRLEGLCDECGYDLTALESRRCPECGTAVESPVGSTPPGDAADATARD